MPEILAPKLYSVESVDSILPVRSQKGSAPQPQICTRKVVGKLAEYDSKQENPYLKTVLNANRAL